MANVMTFQFPRRECHAGNVKRVFQQEMLTWPVRSSKNAFHFPEVTVRNTMQTTNVGAGVSFEQPLTRAEDRSEMMTVAGQLGHSTPSACSNL